VSAYSWGAYTAGRTCTGTARPGPKNLLAYTMRRFPYTSSLGVCSCRPPSEHAECRAVDIRIPTKSNGDARADLGDPIVELLGPHGRRLGLSNLIYDETIYSQVSPDGRPYTGDHDHKDHIHAGFTVAGADNLTMATLIAVLGPAEPGQGGDDMELIEGIQRALNAAGFKGADGKVLAEDGVWGANTEHAFMAMCKDARSDTGGVTLAQGDARWVQQGSHTIALK